MFRKPAHLIFYLGMLTTSLRGLSACQDPGVTTVNPTEISVMYGYVT